jgi:two-component system sensor histidine kinase DesK
MRPARLRISSPMATALIVLPATLATGLPVEAEGWGNGIPAQFSLAAVAPLGIVALSLQLRHSFALARGERPRGAVWTALALMAVAYLPLPWFGWSWLALQALVVASVPVILSGRAALAAAALPGIGTTVGVLVYGLSHPIPLGTELVPYLAYAVLYYTTLIYMPALGVYGATRLVHLSAELRDSRSQLATQATREERLRISRDLHDLLGQSLSAISLRGELAIRLLRIDPEAARAEMASVAELARETLHEIGLLSRAETPRFLRSEVDGALVLLSAAGITAHAELDVDGLSAPVEGTLAWALREGVANIIRHSEARTASITARHADGSVTLAIANDGAAHPGPAGGGLTGIAERARALLGEVSTSHDRGRFELCVRLPGESR